MSANEPAWTPTSPVTALRGIGPQRAEALKQAGIESIAELLAFLPERHEDRRVITPVADLGAHAHAVVHARVKRVSGRFARRGPTVLRVTIADESGEASAVYFNQPYRRDSLHVGSAFYFAGAVTRGRDGVALQNPDTAADAESIGLGRMLPIYRPPEGIPATSLRRWIESASALFDQLPSPALPAYAPAGDAWPPRGEALRACHFPADEAAFERACERLRFEELLAFQTAIAERRGRFVDAPARDVVTNASLRAVVASLPFSLTAGQAAALEGIASDLRGPQPMHRLLHGDVGSGKTAVATAAIGLAVSAGTQCAVMVPTEVLVDQWCREVARLLEGLDVKPTRVTGSMTARDRRAVDAAVAAGDTRLVVGTHAVLSLTFRDLGLVVVDEEQRFGVRQRERLVGKGPAPHVLVLSATPIPRTLALTAYGDLDVTTIPDRPPGRQTTKTYVVEPARGVRAWRFVADKIAAGGRAFVICPSIEGAEGEARSVAASADSLATGAVGGGAFRSVAIGRLHGKMPSEEKQSVVDGFKRGDTPVLVTTTVVEVGIDVPAADVIVIQRPDRFGLAQLHQLRGRVGRGGQESFCLLMLEGDEAITATDRLETFQSLADGFKVAEADLDLRGPGELLGVRQHGLPRMVFADPRRDGELMEAARRAAFDALGVACPGGEAVSVPEP